jgi:hypothetical protein
MAWMVPTKIAAPMILLLFGLVQELLLGCSVPEKLRHFSEAAWVIIM